MTWFAVPLQVWEITRSSFAVGALGFTIIPQLVAGLYGGSIADHLDRRKLALVSVFFLAAISAGMAALAGTRHLWPIFLLVACDYTVASLATPARRTFVRALLPDEQLTAGMALQTLSGRITMLAGPALGGVVAGAWGLRACYAIDAASFVFSMYAMYRLPAIKPDNASGRRPAIREGLHYIRRQPLLVAAFLTVLDVVMLGLPIALFPALNAEHFGGRPQTLGLMTAAIGAGGMLTAVLSGPTSRHARQGRGMLFGAIVWGVAMAGFGLTRSLPLALGLLALAGAVDTLTVTFRSAMVQAVTPDEFRGRVSSVEMIIGAGGPIGSVESGSVAALTSPVFSAVSGGLGCVAVAVVLAVAFPAFRRYSSRPEGIPEPTAATASAS